MASQLTSKLHKLTEAIEGRVCGMNVEQLCIATGYEFSGGFRNALAELRTAGVLVGRNNEVMRAHEDLF